MTSNYYLMIRPDDADWDDPLSIEPLLFHFESLFDAIACVQAHGGIFTLSNEPFEEYPLDSYEEWIVEDE